MKEREKGCEKGETSLLEMMFKEQKAWERDRGSFYFKAVISKDLLSHKYKEFLV
jgi:hypothetical protein